jgi:hypothetical protein
MAGDRHRLHRAAPTGAAPKNFDLRPFSAILFCRLFQIDFPIQGRYRAVKRVIGR